MFVHRHKCLICCIISIMFPNIFVSIEFLLWIYSPLKCIPSANWDITNATPPQYDTFMTKLYYTNNSIKNFEYWYWTGKLWYIKYFTVHLKTWIIFPYSGSFVLFKGLFVSGYCSKTTVPFKASFRYEYNLGWLSLLI